MQYPTVFILLIAAWAIDLLSGLTWWPDYFRVGIPLFVRRQPYSQALPALPASKALGDRFSGTAALPLLFRRLSSTEIAIREAFWGGFLRFNYTPLVHGLLEVDETSREMKIIGRANAFPLVFLAAFASNPLGIECLVFLVAALFLIQYVRYGNVLREALNLVEETNGHA